MAKVLKGRSPSSHPKSSREFGGKRFELYQEHPVAKTIARDVASSVKGMGGKARVVPTNKRGYYVVYAREIKG